MPPAMRLSPAPPNSLPAVPRSGVARHGAAVAGCTKRLGGKEKPMGFETRTACAIAPPFPGAGLVTATLRKA
jgi:hypothetical protein